MADIEPRQQSGLQNMKNTMAEMPMGRKLAAAGALALVVGGFIALMLWMNRPDYQVLYSGLNQRDAAGVVNKLKELKVPYELSGGGGVIKVPQDKLYDARLAMAEAGLPKGAGIGFEVFNEVKIGSTEFMQKVNYQRALQGELARTIASFDEVEEARVHLVMPRESLFVEDEKKPTASVVLRMSGGRKLTKRQIQGVVYLVASSVPDLSAENVTVVDSAGNLLYRKEQDTEGFPGALTASQLEYQKTVEGVIKGKVQSMLEQVLGAGRAVVRVATDIDFTRTSTTERNFNPDQVAVRSETRSSDKSKDGAAKPVGSPDQRFNLATRNANPPGTEEGSASTQERENETTNFEISNTLRQTSKAIGGLKKLSVAVVVDGPYRETTAADGKVSRTFAPRSEEEMRQLLDIVRRAVGYNEQRGDEVSLVNVPFAMPDGVGMAAERGWMDYAKQYSPAALNVLLVLLFFLMVVRPLMKAITKTAQPAEEAAPGEPARAMPGEELPEGVTPADLLEGEPVKKLGTRELILQLVQQDPERATAVLRAWIQENA